jgi:hypothetical protein
MTENNNNRQTDEKQGLTERQLQAMPFLVAAKTITEGCEKAGIDRTLYYQWLEQLGFKAELGRRRDEVTAEAFAILSQNITRAVETLTGLLDTYDDRLKRLVCNDIIDHILQRKEIEDLDKRLTAIEQRLADNRN